MPTIVPYTYEHKREQAVDFYGLIEPMKILVATEKPFAKAAVEAIANVVKEAGMELALLEKYTEKAELLEAVKDADALIVRSDKVTADVMAAAPQLKIVVRAGAGYDNVDCAAATERGIVVMNTPGQNANAVAELALGMMIYMSRNTFKPGTGKEVSGKKLGIHGYGNIGQIVGRYGKALGMEVYALSPSITDMSIFENNGVTRVETAEELYAKCDYISLHIPATPKYLKSVDRHLLESMPKGAILVNTARKEVINEEDLMAVLGEREDLKYASDIAAACQAELVEKYGNRVFATPKKQGAETAEANYNAAKAAAMQIVDFFVNGNRKFQVNK